MNADMSVTVRCSFCGQRSPDLLRCNRCKEVYYCSKDCQRGHWRAGHREQCVAVNRQGKNKFHTVILFILEKHRLKNDFVVKSIHKAIKIM